ncbi:N-acetylmuramoyl-L-alanine amidase [Paenibacillus sophorae]|uniref:N-acetylmuramoyl-L-alanine amidase n=2 Tax=Paenibacillus sophorae TaxID=1333845 RepID=A0A1H8TAX2_9BACL|nr:cell wall hydrolase [Paenibacillus sophorae]SEO88087.1 N-acetylmuramoyl-L-alanine amidase [Paenibacillus sophorae]
MSIFKQNRWMLPLLGVILVCFSAIILLLPELGLSGERDKLYVGRLQSPLLLSAPRAGDTKVNVSERTKPAAEPALKARAAIVRQSHPELSTVSQTLATAWKPVPASGWMSVKQWVLKDSSTPVSVIAKNKASAAAPIRHPQNAREARRKVAAGTARGQSKDKKTAVTQKHPPAILYFSRNKLLSREERDQTTRSYAVSEEEVLLLQKIVMAEAEGEPYKGKVAVANVVLNRLRSAQFPNTIKAVIYQKHQFSPVANGRLKRVKPNQDSIRAVSAALSGVKEVTDDTYYFLSLKLAQDLTVHHSQTFSEKIGNHSFYR